MISLFNLLIKFQSVPFKIHSIFTIHTTLYSDIGKSLKFALHLSLIKDFLYPVCYGSVPSENFLVIS